MVNSVEMSSSLGSLELNPSRTRNREALKEALKEASRKHVMEWSVALPPYKGEASWR